MDVCGEEGSETADAGAPSTIDSVEELVQIPATIPVLSQRAVAVEIVLYKAYHIYM